MAEQKQKQPRKPKRDQEEPRQGYRDPDIARAKRAAERKKRRSS